LHQGCQICVGKLGQNGKKYTKLTAKYTERQLNPPNGLKIPNGHEIYLSTYSSPRPSKMYQNLYFWFKNIPSGKPALHSDFE
jgi:hypothetical protein